MTKILFLVTQSEMGGAQRYIYEVIRGLDSEKYEFLVGAGEGDEELFKKISKLKTQNSKLQLKTQNLKNLKRAPNPIHVIRAVAEIVRILKKEKPDVLFLCSTTAGLLGSIARIFYKVKVIYRIGGWAFRDPRPFFLNWIILSAEKITAPLKDKIVVNSEIDRKLALKYKIASPGKIIKIYNGIDLEKIDFLPKEEARKSLLKSDFNKSVVGTVANFYKTKGLEYLIEAARKLGTVPNFVIIGEGRLRPKLEALIKKYNLENKVFLAGRIPDAYKCLKAFDVFVLPSLKEGFPWIILEAIAAEIPIVATKVGAIPEILDEEFLVEPKDPEALAKKISWMLKHPANPKLKPEFTLQTMLRKTDLLLQTR
jgi:glycosyltransferase involved in cell wall biosynthesis